VASEEERRRENFAKLAAEIDAEGGISPVEMRRLRDAHLEGKLGVNNVVRIANHLSKAGIGVLPPLTASRSLPREQNETVILYTEKSKVGEIVEAVRRPSSPGVRLLREVARTDANEILDQIRSLVCEPE
jgi:hypothetical protein